jgi:hypothetical protein
VIQAIETVYKGYRFRSRLEARWAVYLDAIPAEWQYEAEGYENEDGVRYLPDFYLPGYGVYLEIKGRHPSEVEKQKMRMLGWHGPHPVFCFVGSPWEMDADSVSVFGGEPYRDLYCAAAIFLAGIGVVSNHAAVAAQQARFEHGEHADATAGNTAR